MKADNVNICLRELASGELTTVSQASQPLTEKSNGPQFPYPQNGYNNRIFLLFNQYILITHCMPRTILGLRKCKMANSLPHSLNPLHLFVRDSGSLKKKFEECWETRIQFTQNFALNFREFINLLTSTYCPLSR